MTNVEVPFPCGQYYVRSGDGPGLRDTGSVRTDAGTDAPSAPDADDGHGLLGYDGLSGTAYGAPQSYARMFPTSEIMYDGSDSQMRRLTGIGQPGGTHVNSGEKFGSVVLPGNDITSLSASLIGYTGTAWIETSAGGRFARESASSELNPEQPPKNFVAPDLDYTGED